MSPPKRLAKAVLQRKCKHCASLIKEESVTLTHSRGDKKHTIKFCSSDCMVEYLYDEQIQENINREVRKEFNWLHKQICPACRRRIT